VCVYIPSTGKASDIEIGAVLAKASTNDATLRTPAAGMEAKFCVCKGGVCVCACVYVCMCVCIICVYAC
jgi:hypothetical protein